MVVANIDIVLRTEDSVVVNARIACADVVTHDVGIGRGSPRENDLLGGFVDGGNPTREGSDRLLLSKEEIKN